MRATSKLSLRANDIEEVLNADSNTTVFRASWVCPLDQPPIPNGCVTVCQNKIVAVDPFDSAKATRVVDLGNGAIIPGLVNAHTHLEFSDLESPLGVPGIGFTDWIRLVVSGRNETSQRQSKTAAIEQGLKESIGAGVWTIGEIATSPFRLGDYRTAHEQQTIMMFLEQLGQSESTLPAQQESLAEFLGQQSETDPSRLFGASPHAPYSVQPGLLRQICRQSIAKNRPVAMHLAETLAERELLESQTGEFVSLLQDFGAWNPESFRSDFSIAEIIASLSQASRSLVIHGDYLNDSELDLNALHADRMSVVYCPRTHAFFGHENYPLESLLKRGIRIAVGTDSRASNPDLNLFDELKHVANTFGRLDRSLILEMGTLGGANALGLERDLGSLSVGKRAAMSFVSDTGESSGDSPFEWMFSPNTRCRPIDESG